MIEHPGALFYFKKVVAIFTDPLTALCVLGGVSLFVFFAMSKKLKKWRYPYFLSLFTMLWVLATPIASHMLMKPIQDRGQLNAYGTESDANYIVTLACAHNEISNLPATDMYETCTLRRIIHTVLLHKKTGLPIILTGGVLGSNSISEAEFSAALAVSLGVDSSLIIKLPEGFDTASETRAVAKNFRDSKLILVTSASHILRSSKYLEREGVSVYSSAVDHGNKGALVIHFPSSFIPNSDSLKKTSHAIYEYMALFSEGYFE